MKFSWVLLILLSFLMGCTDVNPQVAYLKVPVSQVQSGTFVDTNLSGAQRSTTPDGFKGNFVIQNGTSLSRSQTSDGFTVNLRNNSY